MKLYYEDKDITLYEGKMQDVLDTLPDNSIDSIVCDPPYDLTRITKRFGKENSKPNQFGKDGSFSRLSKGFLGKTWDGTGVAFDVETWEKALRVLKPGGYLLAFGGTRTFHRMAVAIEDAGFEIRDCIMWLYGSGFPKSLNVGYAIDKLSEKENPHIYIYNKQNWESYGTALKPAFEPIIMARKPIEDSVARNCLKYGVGAINIDECRVYGEEKITSHNTEAGTFAGRTQTMPKFKSKLSFGQYEDKAERIEYTQHEGRFPANVITDGSDEVASGMPNTKSEGGNAFGMENGDNSMFGLKQQKQDICFHDEGSAMRYFYQAKASKKDRDEGLVEFEEKQRTDGCIRSNIESARKFGANSGLAKNIHPTVKPVELMQYLVRLVTPKGTEENPKIVLDCFMGSGSTGKAVMFENRERDAHYKFIGIEMTEEYLPIAKSRIIFGRDKFEYEAKKELEEIKEKTGQLNIFDFN